MSKKGEHTQREQEKQVLEWGELILSLRTQKHLTRSALISRCCKRMSEIDPEYDDKDVPNEAWLARVERNESVTATRQKIELLCAALCATPRQRWEILIAAGLNVFTEPDGEATPESRLLSFAYLTLLSSVQVRRAVRRFLRDHQDTVNTEEKLYLEVLQVALQARQDELKKNERVRPSSIDTSIALSGAD